jgi:tetratricopeptide (TPR) repeat protein
MFNSRSFTGLPVYQNAHASPEDIKAGFFVRHFEYNLIMNDLLTRREWQSVQHYLLMGRRGSGKSTLLRRIQVELDTNEQLAGYLTVKPAEEQANIYRLADLLLEVIREMEVREMDVEWPQQQDKDDYDYADALLRSIHPVLEKTGKKLVLLLDNLDRIFANLGEELYLLRAHLQNFGDIKIIGGSTRLTEHFWAYDQPFYEFFRVMHLRSLDSAEMKGLFLNWADRQQIPQLKELVEKRPGQLEAIRLLTDGLPRTLQLFVQILIAENPNSGYKYLLGVMDEATGIYQERLNSLPPAQRKIVLHLAFFWEATGTRELAQSARMDTKIISAQLNQLVEKKVVDKVETDNKNHLYRLSERFFNLWLIITQGNADDRRKAKYLTVFLESFYDKAGLIEFASAHLQAMKMRKIAPDKAVLLTKGLSRVKAIDSGTRDELIKANLTLDGLSEEMKKEIPPTTREVYDRVEKWMAVKDWQRALQQVEDIEQEDGTKDFITGIIYREMGDPEKEELYYEKAAKFGLRNALHDLLVLYVKQERFEAAERTFWQAYERKLPVDPESLMGFRRVFGDPGLKWEGGAAYPFWYEHDLGMAAIHLASEYNKQEKFDLTEKYFKLAIGLGNEDGYYNLGLHYYLRNGDRKIALALLNDYFHVAHSPGKLQYSFYVTLKAWAGDLGEMDRLISLVIAGEEYVYGMLVSLLVHQRDIIKRLFASQETKALLKEKYMPLYYATTLLTDGTVRAERKVPPEIRETVESIMKEVCSQQQYYYPDTEKQMAD